MSEILDVNRNFEPNPEFDDFLMQNSESVEATNVTTVILIAKCQRAKNLRI